MCTNQFTGLIVRFALCGLALLLIDHWQPRVVFAQGSTLQTPGVSNESESLTETPLSGDQPKPALAQRTRDAIVKLVELVCASDQLSEADLTAVGLKDTQLDREAVEQQGRVLGVAFSLVLSPHRYRITRLAPSGQLRRINIDVFDSMSPDQLLAAVIANAECAIQGGRMRDASNSLIPDKVYPLSNDLRVSGESIAINPEFNSNVLNQSESQDGVRVAIVDSGVDYRQPSVVQRLARDSDGKLVGYDFWDMDDRPFDSHPRAHPFYVQRHGTRTASIIADESPVARLVVYRYPRPQMSRMASLIEHAAVNGVRIMNLSLGGRKQHEWDSYYQSAKQHPDMLFVVSAGNNGVDIDTSPVWPASFDLPNQITVTSALNENHLAERVNFGARAVDLMVPAENMIAMQYGGRVRLVSGSSYAAARISALAACLQASHPQWSAVKLRDAIFALAKPVHEQAKGKVAVGFMSDPILVERGACKAQPSESVVSHQEQIHLAKVGDVTHRLAVTVAVNRDSDWTQESVMAAIKQARAILRQCDVDLHSIGWHEFTGGVQHRYFDERVSLSLLSPLPDKRPVVVFLQRSLQGIEYGAQAYGRSNTRQSKWLRDSVWMMADVEHPGIALAHELYHVLADSGLHKVDPGNLMNAVTTPAGDHLTDSQCGQLRNMALAGELIEKLQ